jgi:AAHS family 4-hydroxybenzoate transporter-like MFS transporter
MSEAPNAPAESGEPAAADPAGDPSRDPSRAPADPSRDSASDLAANALDVRQLIDERPLGGFQRGVAILCGAIVLLDGFDAQIMGYVAPRLREVMHLEPSAVTPLLVAGLVGMMIGALVFGPVADRIGRRPVLLICPVIFGVGSLLTATADTPDQVLVFRLLTGLGMGGAMPNAIALTAEYMPKRARATAVTTMFCGFSIGAAIVGWVAAAVMPAWGWQSVFVIGGALPVVITAVSVAWLPESIRFLLRRRPGDPRAARYLAKIAPDAPRGDLLLADEGARGASVVSQLFVGGRRWVTLLLWVMFFANLLDLYFVNSWLPTIMKGVGIAETRAILITTLFQVGGTAGAIVVGRLIDRNLSFRVLALAYLGAALCVFLIGKSGTSTAWLIVTVFAAGLGVIGAQNGANAMAAETYPTESRSTGVGWALGIGRIGSIVGPTIGGILVGAKPGMLVGGAPRLFLYAAVPLMLAATAALAAAVLRRDRFV